MSSLSTVVVWETTIGLERDKSVSTTACYPSVLMTVTSQRLKGLAGVTTRGGTMTKGVKSVRCLRMVGVKGIVIIS